MTSFLSRLKGGTGPSSPSTGNTPVKKDPHAPQPTPLEKLLADASGPVRPDGSDKFFGFENFGSTCYCNSIIQCLYYSAPFRENVVNFPVRSPPDSLGRPSSALPRINTTTIPNTTGDNALSPTKNGPGSPTPGGAGARKPPGAPPNQAATQPGQRPEDNKDSSEYKKKQALAQGPVLNMDYENAKAYGMSESLFSCLKDIFESVIAHQSRYGIVSPHKFLEILRRENEMFRTAMHQDAHEFLNLLLNQVVENVEQFAKIMADEQQKQLQQGNGAAAADLAKALAPAVGHANPAQNTKWVHDLFEGILTSETRCLTCENTSQRDESFLDLSVDLDQHSSVTSCLRKFSEEEMLCERNKFHCDNCGGLQEAEKRMKVRRLPRILALHLKRFKFTEDFQRLQKLFHRVVYPFYLRLFNTTDDAEDPDRLYELYSVVVHIGGGPYHGHYVSIIKTQDRGWLLFDDELVEPVDKQYVRNFFGGEGALACAYVLFYQETTVEAMQKELEAEGLAAQKAAAKAATGEVPNAGKPEGVLANGHTSGSPTTPVAEEDDHFANLDHALTAPGIPTPAAAAPAIDTKPIATRNKLEHSVTSPGLSSLSPWTKKDKDKPQDAQTVIDGNATKDNKKAEKERKAAEAAAEKERKAAAKEAERLEKEKVKEAVARRREIFRKQDEELKAAIEASKASARDESLRQGGTGAEAGGDATAGAKENGHAPKGDKDKEKGGLSRFKHSSMSLRHKPKFWPGGGSRDVSNEEALDTSNETTALPQSKEDEKKSRFSLGRKKSGML